MLPKKIVTVLGARPQFIKASVVSAALATSPFMREVVVHTGQHFEANMSDVFFDELQMRTPDYCCQIHGGTHGAMTGRMLIEVEQILLTEKPDAVMVYGDTNSTLAGALAAVKLGIPVAHVEAGLRSMNMSMPEEINRILTDRISRWLFAPTAIAASHLQREGTDCERIHVVGDVMLDVARRHGMRRTASEGRLAYLRTKYGIKPQSYCLATIHRAESTDQATRLRAIVCALAQLGRDVPVVVPLHPRTRKALQRCDLLQELSAECTVIEPLGYLDMVQLEKFAALIITDSGGVQKEAFFHRVPCVTLRGETEWTELIESGWNRLASPDDVDEMLSKMRAAFRSQGREIAPYGDGNAARRIVDCLEAQL